MKSARKALGGAKSGATANCMATTFNTNKLAKSHTAANGQVSADFSPLQCSPIAGISCCVAGIWTACWAAGINAQRVAQTCAKAVAGKNAASSKKAIHLRMTVMMIRLSQGCLVPCNQNYHLTGVPLETEMWMAVRLASLVFLLTLREMYSLLFSSAKTSMVDSPAWLISFKVRPFAIPLNLPR